MLSINDLKVGTKIVFNNDPYEVVFAEHSKVGRGGGFVRAKLKNLRTAGVIDYTFKGNESLAPADLEKKYMQYLYRDDGAYYFMDKANYSQISIASTSVGESGKYLKEGTETEVLFYNDEPISINVPIKIILKITYTEPGLKGDTVSSPSKPAELETGAKIFVPLFLKSGDSIVVDTRAGSYVERTKS